MTRITVGKTGPVSASGASNREVEFLVDQRLVGMRRQIDHRQTAMTEGQRAVGITAFVIRAAPRQTRAHP
jgi:hypothetical protein